MILCVFPAAAITELHDLCTRLSKGVLRHHGKHKAQCLAQTPNKVVAQCYAQISMKH